MNDTGNERREKSYSVVIIWICFLREVVVSDGL